MTATVLLLSRSPQKTQVSSCCKISPTYTPTTDFCRSMQKRKSNLIDNPYLRESATVQKLHGWFPVAAIAALTLRFALFALTNAHQFLSTRIELSTPLTSWKRGTFRKEWRFDTFVATEGLYLFQNGLSPYDGGVFHQVCIRIAIDPF
jgi:hypothetical protein